MNILVVEDNRDIAENIADYLEPRGHSLDFAADGRLGLQLALDHDFDVIVLDLMLPRMDGMTVCQKLREAHRATPVLMLTARDQLDDKLAGFQSGADDYLVKPFSVKELEARLHALIKRVHHFGDGAVLQVADLSFNQQTLQASRAGMPLELNPTQRKLLELLMKSSPAVVKRDRLEELIWGDLPPDNDVLRTHIYSLRNIIDRSFEKKLLHTVHGVGYRLSDT
ncbi:response regulator transcription factor [Porticoccus hydrocarbonoclasticus]|jgi:DNA-binding response OmpR family regulator|uniref:response regulator transcription factor n=1 Tax=Porticoccus hydrocarbonoclasticus TaxID=1073414 RepID=UPI00056CF371|nr:response regulator transcription factor [Porticoccus hydrocarbonoclasticus]|tara:strand:- start:791 stop:1462 length:672 start_codon:yes stop_codon:yes gene_type:complete